MTKPKAQPKKTQLKKRITIGIISAFLFCCGWALQLSPDADSKSALVEAQHTLLVAPEAQPLDLEAPPPSLIGTRVTLRHASTIGSWL